jgi:hypothetical protein
VAEHNVTPDEVEEACVGDSYTRKTGEGRYLVYVESLTTADIFSLLALIKGSPSHGAGG